MIRLGILAGVALATVGASCSEAPSSPTTLLDGSQARPPPVVLEGADGPTVATLTRSGDSASVAPGSRAAVCLSTFEKHPAGSFVERIGVTGASVTYVSSDRRTARACDASTLSREARDDAWCGYAFGRLESGVLRDPRLSLTCRDADGDPVGFAWVQPASAAAFVVVRQRGYAEAYAVVAGGLPVRVTTSEVDRLESRATIAISEHARDGRRLRAYELEARVAG